MPTWFVVPALVVVAVVTGVGTFVHFREFPYGWAGFSSHRLGISILVCVLVAPIIAIVALFLRREATLLAPSLHASAMLAFLVIGIASSGSPGHSSPGAALGEIILPIICIGVALEIAAIAFAITRLPPPADRMRAVLVFPGLAVALVVGWSVGAAAWAMTLPPQVIAKAQAIAKGRPYCLLVNGTSVTSRWQLTGYSMRASHQGGWTFEFHSLMIIETDQGREYVNWSYRERRFVYLGDQSIELRLWRPLSAKHHCTPVKDFAARL
jgi:hypothetical protein